MLSFLYNILNYAVGNLTVVVRVSARFFDELENGGV